jgi:colicin import membrane protein
MAYKAKTYEAAQEDLTAAKEERKVAKEEFKAFKKEKGIKGDEAPEDQKLAKKFNKMKSTVDTKVARVEEIEAWMKENKPAKERKPRDTKYEYPDGATAAEKKKIRAAERARLKREAKEASGEGKKSKKAKDGDKKAQKEVVAESKKSKKEKKAEKKAKKAAAAKEEAEESGADD